MPSVMEADVSALLEDILKDPKDGPIRKSFDATGIESTLDLLAAPDWILDVLKYDDNGTDKPIPPMIITKIKFLRDFLMDRNNKRLSLESSSFVIDDFRHYISSDRYSVSIAPLAATMDAVLTALLEVILSDPPDGPIQKSFNAAYVETPDDFLMMPDSIVDTLKYDNNGTDEDIPPLRKVKIKNLRNFLMDRINQNLPIDSSTFEKKDVTNFVAAGGNIYCPPIAPPVSTSVVNG